MNGFIGDKTMTENFNPVTFAALANLNQMAEPRRDRKHWNYSFTPEGVFTHNPTLNEYYKFNEGDAIALNGECQEHMFQLGRAIAQLDFWQLIRIDDGEVIKSFTLLHRHNGRQVMARQNKRTGVCDVFELSDRNRWEYHGMTYLMWKKTPRELGAAYSKYHIIAKLLETNGVVKVIGNEDLASLHIEDAYRRECWMLSGFAPADYPCFNHISEPAMEVVGC
jgi:hypothetical protein